MTMLSVERLDARHGLLHAVRSLDLGVQAGETLAIVGANGAGKTTLLRAIAGAHRPAGGRIMFDGADITAMPAHRRVARGIALVPEGRKLFADLTVEDNLKLARASRRPGRWTVDAVMEIFPNLASRLRARAGTLSGGEQQAVAIGRALMTNPALLLLDEVSLGLSPLAVDRVYVALEMLAASGTTMVLVEQDLGRALRISDRVVCMLEGRAVLEGSSRDLTRARITEAYFGAPPRERASA